jgi:YVTN family beta-propeller protein
MILGCALFVVLAMRVSSATAAPFAYIPNAQDGTVSVIDLATSAVISTIPTGANPTGSAVSQARSLVYITNYDSRTISVISVGAQIVVGTIAVAAKPVGIAVDASGTKAVVTLNDGTIALIDALGQKVVAVIPVGSIALQGVALDPAGRLAYVADFNAQTVRVVDLQARQVVGGIVLAARPFAVAIHPNGTFLYVATQGSNAGGQTLSIIDTTTNTVVKTIPTDGSPLGVAVNSTGTQVYVAVTNFVANTSSLVVVNTATNTVATSASLPNGAFAVGVHPDGSRAYVTNNRTNTVLTIDTTSVSPINSIPVGRGPGTIGDFIAACAVGQVLSAGQCQTPGNRIVEYIDTPDFPLSPGGHFFYTSDPAEQASIDAGNAGRFLRTGGWFKPGGTKQLCRFYGSVVPGPNSHFFTIDDSECAALKAAQVVPTPTAIQQWNYEGLAFSETPPLRDGSSGALSCPAGTSPVYRYYNNAFHAGVKNPWDSNHRYGTDKTALDAYAAANGWSAEGIVFCASP